MGCPPRILDREKACDTNCRWLRLSALLMGFVIFAAACGGDDDGSSGDDTSDTTEVRARQPLHPSVKRSRRTGSPTARQRSGRCSPRPATCRSSAHRACRRQAHWRSTRPAPPVACWARTSATPGDSGGRRPRRRQPDVDGHLAANAGVDPRAAVGRLDQRHRQDHGACKIQFSPANTSPQFTDYDDGDLYFRTAPSDVLQGQVLSELIVNGQRRHRALLALRTPTARACSSTRRSPSRRAAAGGGRPHLRPEAQTFEAEVDEIISEDPDALVMIGFEESAASSPRSSSRATPDEKNIYLVDGNTGNALGEDFTDPATRSATGTLPSAEITEDFPGPPLGGRPG